MTIEVMKQAADKLEIGLAYPGMRLYHDDIRAAITALRTAIAEAEKQEPVALETVYETIIQWDEGGGKRSRRELARRIVDLYTTPPAAQRKPHYDKTEMNCFVQNLYDQKMREGKRGHYETMFHVVHRAIEAAHGIKETNT